MQQPQPPPQGQYPPPGFQAQYPADLNQQPVAGQPVYVPQPIYGQPQYGQPGYVQPAYGQPGYGQNSMIVQPMEVPMVMVARGDLPTTADGMEFPAEIRCPFCRQVSRTRVDYEAGSGTYQACILLMCVTGACWWLPFCMKDCKDKVHHCGQCQHYVGKKAYSLC